MDTAMPRRAGSHAVFLLGVPGGAVLAAGFRRPGQGLTKAGAGAGGTSGRELEARGRPLAGRLYRLVAARTSCGIT